MRYSLREVHDASVKVMDPWWVYFLMRPASVRTTWFVVNYTPLKPNHVSGLSFLAGSSAAWCFAVGDRSVLLLGAALYQVALFLDTVDGKLARVTGMASKRGALVDTLANHLMYLLVLAAFATSPIWPPSVQWAAVALFGFRTLQVVLNDLDESAPTVNVHTPIHPGEESWLRKRGLLYPMTTPDREVVMFFFGPVTGLVAVCLWIGVAMDAALAGLKVVRIWRRL